MFDVGDVVKVKNTRAQSKTNKWLFGSIIEVNGHRNYVVKICSERKLVHADHPIRTRFLLVYVLFYLFII